MITTFLVAHPWLTTVAFLALVLLGPPVTLLLSGHRRLTWTLAVVALLPVAVLTLTPTDNRFSRVTCEVAYALPTPGRVELVANVVLFLAPALLAGVASRRPALVLLGALALSAVIELAQALVLPLGRSCSTSDWASNATGAVIGVALAAVVLAACARNDTSRAAGLRGPTRRPSPGRRAP